MRLGRTDRKFPCTPRTTQFLVIDSLYSDTDGHVMQGNSKDLPTDSAIDRTGRDECATRVPVFANYLVIHSPELLHCITSTSGHTLYFV